MKIVLSPRAEKDLKKIHRLDQIAVVRKLRSLTDTSLQSNAEKLSGYTRTYRIRVGQYRIVYRVKKAEIYIILIGHRKDIYRLLERFIG